MHLTTLCYTLVPPVLFSLQPAVAAALPRALAKQTCRNQIFDAILCSDHSGSFDFPHVQHNLLLFPFTRSFGRSFLAFNNCLTTDLEHCTDPCFPVCVCASFDITEYSVAPPLTYTRAKSEGDNVC